LEEPILSREQVDALENETRRKYSGETAIGYNSQAISRRPAPGSCDYFDLLLQARMDLLRGLAAGGRVLDVGCATGEHLLELGSSISSGVGIDFSYPLVKRAVESRGAGGSRVEFVQGNARCLPFRGGCFELVYSFSSLYYMPNVGEILREIARVLAPGGRCLIEMGNAGSLGAVVADAYPELARSFHIGVGRMKKNLRDSGLRIASHRAFQILPYWGDRPQRVEFWLRPFWKRWLERRMAGRMIDEWICGLPLVGNFAFRHLFVCVKEGGR